MSNNIVQFNEEIFKGQIKELVRSSVEKNLNELLEAEAQKLTTTSGDVILHVPRLKGIPFETAIIERCRRRESRRRPH